MIKDVLVFTPVYRLETETVMGIFSLEWDGPISFLLQRDNPTNDGPANHLHQYQRGRELFLKGPYDAMLIIESDIIPPKTTLKRLARLKCDLAYGCYQFRGSNVSNILQRYYPWPEPVKNMGESLQITPGLWSAAVRQGVIDCSGAGLGCLLIKRKVLEETPFDGGASSGFFDWRWTQQCYSKNYRMKADMLLHCGHKDTDGTILWPPHS